MIYTLIIIALQMLINLLLILRIRWIEQRVLSLACRHDFLAYSVEDLASKVEDPT